eukprot:scaffold9542_cov100-Skeletonema_dohrnii-CCMP3373.AAC.1
MMELSLLMGWIDMVLEVLANALLVSRDNVDTLIEIRQAKISSSSMKCKRFPCGICSNKRHYDSSYHKNGVNVTTHNSVWHTIA